MQIRDYPILGLIGLLLWVPPVPAAGADKGYTEDEETTHSRSLFLRPARDDAVEQLAYADELLERGRLRKADRAYRALVNRWPRQPEAALAQHRHATVLRKRGKMQSAFDALQKLIDDYPGRFQYDEVLQTQFDIAVETMNKRHGKVLFLPGFHSPERALEMLEQVVKNGPRWKHAAEAQYLQGSIREQTMEYELAVLDYTDTLVQYPDSEFAERAAFARARTLVQISEESPNDTDAAQEAWYALTQFNTTFSQSAYGPQVQEYTKDLYHRLAKGAYDIAVFYDTIAHKPKAALFSYESFVSRFPSSQWTPAANQRISELKPVVEIERAAP